MTMYEKLMALPIFKGISANTLSLFLEVTPLEFKNYRVGELLGAAGAECHGLKCLLSGEIDISYPLYNGLVQLVAHYGSGKILGLEHLYGMSNQYTGAIKATRPCSTAEMTKSQYFRIVEENKVCLINLLNYLSYRSQKVEWFFNNHLSGHVAGIIAALVGIYTDRDVKSILIRGLDKIIKNDFSCGLGKYESQILLLEKWGIISVHSDGCIFVPSRIALMDYAEELLPSS